MSTGTTFKPGSVYDQSQTGTTGTLRPVKIEDPRLAWKRGFLKGYADGARDFIAGKPRRAFGSFAITAYAAGYRAAVDESDERKG